jgi:hypothetical protein
MAETYKESYILNLYLTADACIKKCNGSRYVCYKTSTYLDGEEVFRSYGTCEVIAVFTSVAATGPQFRFLFL